MPRRAAKETGKRIYMISAVSKRYGIHPQTLRLYERDGLLRPSRTDGNTRYYTDDDLERLEVILNLTRNLGINLAGIEVILNMREKMNSMQEQLNGFIEFFFRQMEQMDSNQDPAGRRAIVRRPSRAMQLLMEHLEKQDGPKGK